MALKSIDFSRITPAVIRYEHEHLSKTDYDASVEMLANYGYSFIIEKRDVVALKVSVLD